MDSAQLCSTTASPNPSGSCLSQAGMKAQAKRCQQLRKNGLSLPAPSRSGKPCLSSAARKTTTSSRMLFGPVDHNEVREWLEERLDHKRRQLTEQYGFDVTLAEEGVYQVPARQAATSPC